MRSFAAERAEEPKQELALRYAPWLRPALAALLVALAYYIGAHIGFALTFKPHPVSTLWPPNSILLASLLLTPKRWWGLILGAALPAHLIIQLNTGVPIVMVICWFVSNCAEALIGAAFITYAMKGPVRFDTSQGIAVFVCAAVLGPFLSSFLDSAFVVLNAWGAGSYWEIWRMRFFANVLAALTLVPFIVMWVGERPPSLRKLSPYRLLEAGTLVTILLIVGFLVLNSQNSAKLSPAILYTPLPLLLWAAVRFGPKGVSSSLVAVTFLAIWGAIHGWGPFANSSPEENAFSVQLFLILISLPLITLAALIQEQMHLREVARKDEEQLALALNAAKRSEEELLERNRQIRALAGRLISAQESERRRMSRELHDDLSQKVAALSISISHLKRKLPDTPQETIDALNALYHDANDLTGHIRQLSHELHPATLQHLGLEKALSAYIAQFDREEEIETSFKSTVKNNSIPFELSVCLYRVAVEGLRNIAKHSQSQTASVLLHEDGDSLILEIADSGRGFDIEIAKTQGIGLISAEERVRLLQGQFVIMSTLNGGTKLIAKVPLNNQ